MTHEEVFKAAVRAANGLLEPGEAPHAEYLRGLKEMLQRLMEELGDPQSRDRGEEFLAALPRRLQATIQVTRTMDDEMAVGGPHLVVAVESITAVFSAWKSRVLAEFNKAVPGCAKQAAGQRSHITEMTGGPALTLYVDLDFTHTMGELPDAAVIDSTFFREGAVAGSFILMSRMLP
jgi:hypothetical protein